jgi:4-amino-4-deoxy-L-arabinose transferase-like glycosyltransferase
MPRHRWLLVAVTILLAATALRTMWLRADPPNTSVGIVWHDEGAWVHNARNAALWGAWRTDNWNPVFIAPVFTALEYGAFRAFGVGTWQARTVPVASGLLALIALMAGLHAASARHPERTALIGGAVLAVNFTWVAWNRAALMESTMTMFIVMAWAAYAMASRRPLWGVAAGIAAVLAFFTKAAAAFFIAAIVLDAAWTIVTARSAAVRARLGLTAPSASAERAALLTLAGVGAAGAAICVAFVWPNWREFEFYNFQMTVTRKPTYDLWSFISRASALPLDQDVFSRMWLVLLGASLGMVGLVAGWRNARPADRLLVLWVLLGLAELVVHDSTNARRYVMFVPALVALAALFAGEGLRWLPDRLSGIPMRSRLLALPLLLLVLYLLAGAALRPAFADQVASGSLKASVRLSAALAVLGGVATVWWWRAIVGRLASIRVAPSMAVLLVIASVAGNLYQYVRWASHHTQLNYEASVEIGEILAPGTLVQGKLANGLALENQIKPIFVGRGFGNWEDRLSRDDARYILTISLPEEGRETQQGLMREILERYPNRRVIASFDVDETPGLDRAVLVDKNPASSPAVSGSNRAPD